MGIKLQVDFQEKEHKVIVRVEGRLDAASSPLLEKKLHGWIAQRRTDFLVDLSRVDYLSSAGIRVLLGATQKLRQVQRQLILFSLSEPVREIVRVAAFDTVLCLCSTEEEALQIAQ